MRKPLFALLLFLFVPAAHAQTAYLVKDLNTTTNANAASSSPKDFFRHRSRIYFSAYTPATGIALFATDGTEAGTGIVANIAAGTAFSSPSRFIDVNGNLVFNARDAHGEELWTTDGTAAGTRLMADINTGAPSSSPGDRIVFNGRMFFAAQESVYGRELWVTDGTAAGTKFFKDLRPGPGDSSPQSFVLFNGAVYFSADDALWKTDGTEAGTVVVKSGMSSHGLTVAANRIFFHARTEAAGTEPWVSDGTEAGTFMLRDIVPGRDGSSHWSFTPLGNRVLFLARTREHGSEWWVSDGTVAGTHMLRDIHPGSESSSNAAAIAVLGNLALFAAASPETGVELWQTDGTSAGTMLFRDLVPGKDTSSVANLINVNGSVYFATADTETARIWVTDGTPGGTRPITGTSPRLRIGSVFTNIDGTLYFSAADPLHGFEPWRSDGTAAGTKMLVNLSRDAAPSSDPNRLEAAGDWVYFQAWDGFEPPPDSPGRDSFWRTDGTPEGTVKLSDGGPSELDYPKLGRTILFERDSAQWVSDGTPEGTTPAKELTSRFEESARISHVVGDTLLVSSDEKLWATKLAPGSPVVPLDSDTGWSYENVAGRAIYYTYSFGRWSLWITDGTPEGTFVLKELPHQPRELTAMGGHVYFTTFEDGSQLWRTDGTTDGTVVVAPLPQGGGNFIAAGKNLFFIDGREGTLWVSDGTAAGTRELQATPARVVYEPEMAAIGSSVVFAANDPTNGTELWISDGTAEGTRVLLDIHPGALHSSPGELTSAGGAVYFRAYSPLSGTELWVTDGTAAGTKLAADIMPGTDMSHPQELVAAGERLFFAATTAGAGKELWALPLSPRMTIEDARVTETAGTARVRVTLSPAQAQTVTVEYATANGTAAEGVDYDAAAGTLTFAPGETSKTIDVHVRADAAIETNETFHVSLRNPSGAMLERALAAGIIEDDDQIADVSLGLDFTFLRSSITVVTMKNAGPSTATNLRPRTTVTPVRYAGPSGSLCQRCRLDQIPPNGSERAFEVRELALQLYLTATVTARERDPDASNNTIGWTARDSMAMDALYLTPGSQANLWVSGYGALRLESSDPAVVEVPASVTTSNGAAASVVVRGLKAGSSTIRAFSGNSNVASLLIDVVAQGTQMRWPGGVEASLDEYGAPFDRDRVFSVTAAATAPFSGATATGVATISSNGRELARVELVPGSRQARVPFYFPEVGDHPITIHYTGDANFLPMTYTFQFPHKVSPGQPTIRATATRNGAEVVVRARISGSPMAAPTGTITIDGTQVPLTAIGPGLAEAEVTLRNVPPATTMVLLRYSGDTRYNRAEQSVPITQDRRRTVRP